MFKRTLLFMGLIAVLVVAGAGSAFASSTPQVKIETSMGDIVLELNRTKAPKTVDNFIRYVQDGFYDGTIFHRVINSFMIQGGGFDENMSQKDTGSAIQNEADNGLSNAKYTIAMARTNQPHSATAQFFINVENNLPLNHSAKTSNGWGYCVFGRVIQGQDVVDKIKAVPTASRGMHQNVPITPVVIKKATVVKP